MTPRDNPDQRVERELLARLGIETDANTQEITAAYDEVVEYLEKAPHELQAWARHQMAAADEAYALLADPTTDRSSALVYGSATANLADEEGAPALRPVRNPAGRGVGRAIAPKRGGAGRAGVGARRGSGPVSAEESARVGGRLKPLYRRLAVIAGAVVVLVAVIVGVYNLGGGSLPGINGTPAPEASSAVGAPDPAQVGPLMAKIAANPQDVASLQGLANLYFGVGDYKTAADFLNKIVAIQPTNVDALLALGTAQYNLGDIANAQKNWLAATAADPKNAQAYYLLGFSYLSDTDNSKLLAAWNQVIAIDPCSDLAKNVRTHLANTSPAPASAPPTCPSSAPGGSAVPGSSAAPAASSTPAASPVGSGPAPSPSGQ